MIGLVACCGKKLPDAARARDLYVSPLFKKSRAWVEANCDRWFVLSALYGLVAPSEVIAPYDVTLTANDTAWGYRVFAQMLALGIEGERFSALAGERYLKPLRELVTLTEVLKRKPIGERLSYLT